MPLTVLGPLVVFGLLAIALTIRVLRVSQPFSFDSEADAVAALARHMPGRRATGVMLSADRRSALVETPEGGVLIWAFGADTVAHALHGATPAPTRDGLRVRLHDFAAPGPRLALTPQERDEWQRKIEDLAA
ncbi:hypothetical protein PSA7680_03391 [Pseudoruegeria aquimaris]|uniref:Uncharacterized protein n=1 Tax=Pseudoruegeria aquimaris TaxID=393663 RepID=A0A1Y5THD3_9RHOB|nr:hypothetical protein [Pseudoruegeria aquimaris]SLN64305.1 hypothetical protein PSA7680_03391 [Pseudoruegeria aquimaris]